MDQVPSLAAWCRYAPMMLGFLCPATPLELLLGGTRLQPKQTRQQDPQPSLLLSKLRQFQRHEWLYHQISPGKYHMETPDPASKIIRSEMKKL